MNDDFPTPEGAETTTESHPTDSRGVIAREVVYQSHYRRDCGEFQLVLEAAGIRTRLSHQDGWWKLTVSSSQGGKALAELAAYQRDNAESTEPESPPTPVFGGAFVGVLLYTFAIGLIAFYARLPAFDLPWASIGAMRAGEFRSGEVWRAITALTLHADAQHLLSNLVFGGVFGLLAGRILGGGLAWLAIVIAGGWGNAFCGLIRDADHSSIGASTAVFAALGVLVAHALSGTGVKADRKTVSAIPSRRAWQRWSPVIGGLLMLAFIGVEGERTDVLAHVAGFVAGSIIGSIACLVPDRFKADWAAQVLMGLAATLIVIAAWSVAAWSAATAAI